MEEKERNSVMFFKWCLWSLTYHRNPFAKVILANFSYFQRGLATRTRDSVRNTRWYNPKIARGMDRRWWGKSSKRRVLFYCFC